VGLRESDEPDKIDATISVKETRPWFFSVGASNAGSESSGRDRLTVSGGHSNLFNLDHQFVGAYTTSLERTDDVKQLGLQYKVPLYSLGGVVGAGYTRSDVVGNFGTFTSTGAGHTFGLSYTHYLPPVGGRRSYVSVGVDDKVFDATVINDTVVGVDRRSRPVTLGYTARVDSDTASWGYNAELAANTGSGRNNDLFSYQNEDPRITTVRWKALRGGLNYSAGLAQTWIWLARAQYQYSPDVLISGEQFGLGGIGSVRGTEIDRPLSGDKGLSATVEIMTPELAAGLRLLGFVDAGWLGNNSPNGTNKPSSDRLASAGLGLRYSTGPVALSLDYGRIVAGSRVPLAFNSAAPQEGDERVYVSVSVRF
jgi:hemolysin activation/secretion protein